MLELSQVFFGTCTVLPVWFFLSKSGQTGNFIQVIYKVICRDLAVALALIYILQSVYVIVKHFLKIIGTFCNKTFTVGAGIARPMPAGTILCGLTVSSA
ncbi:MAG: hypothetical protein FWD97_06385 [Defluviitaleaceae bacterium]|nr:hypothetical protein [Defluviitaleaceae bacterium]